MARRRKPRRRTGSTQVRVKPHTRSPRGPDRKKPRPRVRAYTRRFPRR